MVAQAPSKSSPVQRDRRPPYSDEAERGVLGSILLDAERVVDLAVQKGLPPDAFHVFAHRVLYEIVVEMHRENRPIDLLTVGERLKVSAQTDAVGGEDYLESLVDSTPTSAHAEYYMDIVYQKYVLRRIIDQSREAIESCYTEEEDAALILGNTEQAIYDIADMKQTDIRPWRVLIKESMEDIENIYQQKKVVTGIPTGYKDLDKKLLGFQQRDMIIIAARPSMGKTSLALNMMERIVLGLVEDKTPRGVVMFSLEMSSEQLVRRMICSRARVSAHKLAGGGYISAAHHGHLMNAADALLKATVFIDDTPSLSALDLRSRARRLKRKHQIDLIVVDYLQLMNYPQFAQDGREREVASISGALKAMAKELKVPVIVLSQLSRAPETRDRLAKPKLSDLRDSGSIEQDADVVCLLRRPCKYPDDPDYENKLLAVVDVAKHRNGPTGEVHLNFEEDFMHFDDRSREHGVDEEAYAYESSVSEG